jgi:hypothetical protein
MKNNRFFTIPDVFERYGNLVRVRQLAVIMARSLQVPVVGDVSE